MTTGGFTRRGLGRICAAVLMGRRFLHAAKSVPLTWATQPEAGAGLQRRYRADAQIVLLSIPCCTVRMWAMGRRTGASRPPKTGPS